MHIKHLCTIHTTPITVDRRVRITDPGGIKANKCHDWLGQSYSIVRREASCFIKNALIDYYFLP